MVMIGRGYSQTPFERFRAIAIDCLAAYTPIKGILLYQWVGYHRAPSNVANLWVVESMLIQREIFFRLTHESNDMTGWGCNTRFQNVNKDTRGNRM